MRLEERYSAHTPAKEAEIIRRLRMTPVRYYQLVDRLLDEPAALAADPLLVRRLRRRRARALA